MTRVRLLKDGQYRDWEMALVSRFPFALAEMRSPSAALGTPGAQPLARWGIECGAGWRGIVEWLLERLETAIIAQPPESREQYRIVQLKEKFGRLTVYLDSEPTAAMFEAMEEAARKSYVTCDVCAAPGRTAVRNSWYSSRCAAHEQWSPWHRAD